MRRALGAGLAMILLGVLANPAGAGNSWNGYHWATNGGGVALPVIDNMDGGWDPLLAASVGDWDASGALDLTVVAGSEVDRVQRQCKPVAGSVVACNASHGYNGWLGLARIWLDGDHIVQATTQVNDSYFDNYASLDDDTIRRHVLCQELGHDFGLTHRDGQTCMNDQELGYPSPDAHDYGVLDSIYAHDDSATGGGGGSGGGDCPPKSNSPKCGSGRSVSVSADGHLTLVTITTFAPGR